MLFRSAIYAARVMGEQKTAVICSFTERQARTMGLGTGRFYREIINNDYVWEMMRW